MTASPWADPAIARAMRENVDRQLAEVPWPVHFTAYADAVRAVALDRWWTVLECGCGVGHGVQLLGMAEVEHGQFTGLDINEHAIALARERYPDSLWDNVGADALPATFAQRDIVVDGSCVLHVEDWRAHLGYLCGASRDAVILHRVPIRAEPGAPTIAMSTCGYGHWFTAWRFSLVEVVEEMGKHGFKHTETRKADGDSLTLTFRKGKR